MRNVLSSCSVATGLISVRRLTYLPTTRGALLKPRILHNGQRGKVCKLHPRLHSSLFNNFRHTKINCMSKIMSDTNQSKDVNRKQTLERHTVFVSGCELSFYFLVVSWIFCLRTPKRLTHCRKHTPVSVSASCFYTRGCGLLSLHRTSAHYQKTTIYVRAKSKVLHCTESPVFVLQSR